MNEDLASAMEKKNFNPASKKLDSFRPRQDGTGPGQLEKISRATRHVTPQHRQQSPSSAASGSGSKSDSSFRNPPPQKSKAFDKRNRVREPNLVHNSKSEDEPEVGSLQAPGGRKQNLTQLLSFVLPPRGDQQRGFRSHGNGDYPRHHGNPVKAKYNKEQFLQAHCQFYVKEGDYSKYNSDPDLLIDWNLVEQVGVIVTGEELLCPICLYPPMAAKITTCGHVYCWMCMLQYFALSDEKWRSCPTCFEAICKDQLKSAVIKIGHDTKVEEELELQLMRRSKDSLVVEKVGNSNGVDTSFSKLIVMSQEEVESLTRRELNVMNVLMMEKESLPEGCFVREAIVSLTSRVLKNGKFRTFEPYLPYRECSPSEITTKVLVKEDVKLVKPIELSQNADGGGDASQDDLALDSSFYFYQAIDGQNIYLHPLNLAMVKQHFGTDPALWPHKLKRMVIEIEDGYVNQELRKRFKFLSHLPITSCVKLVEIDLSSVVSSTVTKEFFDQLEYRHHRRMLRELSEKKRERQIEEAEKKKKWIPKIESELEFPTWVDRETQDRKTSHSESDDLQKAIAASLGYDSEHPEHSYTQPIKKSLSSVDFVHSDVSSGLSTSPQFSFAQVASASSSGRVWKRSPTFPSGANERGSTMSSVRASSSHHDDPENEYSAPEFRASVSDAIAKAFATANINERNEVTDDVGTEAGRTGGVQKKKGRKKGKVLFSTAFGLGGN